MSFFHQSRRRLSAASRSIKPAVPTVSVQPKQQRTTVNVPNRAILFARQKKIPVEPDVEIDWRFYVQANRLEIYSQSEALEHWKTEEKAKNLTNIDPRFSLSLFRNLNHNQNLKLAHFVSGKDYSFDPIVFYDYFLKKMGTVEGLERAAFDLLLNRPETFRFCCFQNTRKARLLTLPCIEPNAKNIVVFIDGRQIHQLLHYEYVIRVSLHNLVYESINSWDAMFICAKNNFEEFKQLCASISEKIKVHCLEETLNNREDYNNLFYSKSFWSLFHTYERCIIVQEDALIMRPGLERFLKFDYIGAPWPLGSTTPSSIGNGGFTIRNPKKMLEMLENPIHVSHRANDLSKTPEDVFFSIQCSHNSKQVSFPSFVEANSFSVETIYYADPIGFHQPWMAKQTNAQKFVMNTLNLGCKLFAFDDVAMHRSGWKFAQTALVDLLVPNGLTLVEMFEFDAFSKQKFIASEPWIGISHLTSFDDAQNIAKNWLLETPGREISFLEQIATMPSFKHNMNLCRCVITLSSQMAVKAKRFFDVALPGNKVKVISTLHPAPSSQQQFDWQKFADNKEKRALVQLGMQLRITTTIYVLSCDSEKWNKIWCSGRDKKTAVDNVKNEYRCIQGKNIEENMIGQVQIASLKNADYDNLLCKCVALVDLFDASANTSVLDCIFRCTPVLVRKLPATVEYLGEEYPLFFSSVEEAETLLKSDEKLLLAHNYLRNRLEENTKRFSLENFKKTVINAVAEVKANLFKDGFFGDGRLWR